MSAGEFTQGAAKAIQSIVKAEGVRGLFAGYGSFMLRDLPFDAIEFVAYEQLKKAWTKYKGSDIRPHESAVIGGHPLHLHLPVILRLLCCIHPLATHCSSDRADQTLRQVSTANSLFSCRQQGQS